MARSDFGGTTNDFLYRLAPFMKPSAGRLTFWDAESGGTQHTDLLLNGSPVASITVGTDGLIPTFQGPDGVTTMYADEGVPGGKRGRMVTTDAAAVQEAREAAEAARDGASAAAQEAVAGITQYVTDVVAVGGDNFPDLLAALDPEPWFTGDITYDPTTQRVATASMRLPSGATGVYTADVFNERFLAVDAWHIEIGTPVTATYTQAEMERNSDTGQVTYRPPITLGFPPAPYDFTTDDALVFDFDGDSLGADTTAISSWTPTGSLATAAVQATTAAKPVVKAAALNGHKSALFDGTDDTLSTGTYATPVAQPITLVTVYKPETTGATKYVYGGISTAGGNLELSVSTGGSAAMKAGTGTAIAVAGTTFGAWHVEVCVFNGAASSHYRDAHTVAATGTVQSGDAASAMGGMRIGRGASSAFFKGEVARHVAIGRALHASEVADLLDQLGNLYDLTIGA